MLRPYSFLNREFKNVSRSLNHIQFEKKNYFYKILFLVKYSLVKFYGRSTLALGLPNPNLPYQNCVRLYMCVQDVYVDGKKIKIPTLIEPVGWREGMQKNNVIQCTVAPSTIFISLPHHQLTSGP